VWLAARYALRELRSGVKGFRLFLACLALGVAAIAAAGSTAWAFRAGLAAQAREVLGGDLSLTVGQRAFTPAEIAAIGRLGPTSLAVSLEAMAQAPSGERRLVELRGVSGAYPLVGSVDLKGAPSLRQALAVQDGVSGAAVEPALLECLHLRLGDRFLVGATPLVARAILLGEPDRLGRGFALGPRVLTRLETVQDAGFLSAGIPFAETARIALAPGADLAGARARLGEALHAAGSVGGWRMGDRTDAAPGLKRLIAEMEYFLGFIGLASLVAGGLGVHAAVSAHLDRRRGSIAILKVLGAEQALVRSVYLIQVGVLAIAGVVLGIAIGAGATLGLGLAVSRDLPVPALFRLYPQPLLRAAAFGLLAAAAFALGPLGRARATSPAALLRDEAGAPVSLGPEFLAALAAAVLMAALAVVAAPTPLVAAVMIGATAVAFILLWALGRAAAMGAGAARGLTRGMLRIGLANLAGPGSAARTAAPAIGLGLALVSAVVLVQSSLIDQVAKVAPRSAPSLVFTGIPPDRAVAFDREVEAAAGRPLDRASYLRAPFFSGRIVAVNGATIDTARMDPADRWAYDHDIGMSALGAQPHEAGVVRGAWWGADYAGPPLAAVSVDVAKGARLKLGDRVDLDILGRRITARVAVLRHVDVAGFGASFPVILDPAALAGAQLKTVAIARVSPQAESRITRALGADFPQVNVISVREALAEVAQIFDRLALAVRAAAGVAALAGLLVLAGAIAARAPARAREAAVLKVLGATPLQILCAYGVEYGVVGLIAGLAGAALGWAAAWPLVTQVFRAAWSVDVGGLLAVILGSAALAGAGGIIAAAAALGRRPAPVLRAD
jgi:putative ABC transport system permease protein